MQRLEPEQYQADILPLVDRTVAYGEVVCLRGTEGCAVLMSEDEYDAMLETVHLMRDPRVARDILEAAEEELEGCIAEEDAEW